ncbi:Protein casc1 [Mactra antiquata]
MPPKQGSAGKKKLSKAEKEKLKAEEEERKAQEEEEARIKAEEEEKKRKEREKLEQAEQRKQQNAEKENRRMEMLALVDIQEKNKSMLNELHGERRKKSKWARYMRCDGSPDPTVPGEINTYINLRLEDPEHNDIDSVLKQSELDINLINELDFLLEDTPPEDMNAEEVDRLRLTPLQKLYHDARNTREDLQRLIQTKLDAATVKILQQATDLCDSETFNLHYLKKNEEICLCIWGNLSKNPRIKSFEFQEKGYQFDIPRILTLSDVGFRILFTKYDHYSTTCKTYYPRKKKKEEPEVVEEVKPDEEEEKKDDDTEKDKDADAEGGDGDDDKEDTEDLMAMLRQMKGEAPPEDEVKEEEEEKVEDVEEFEDPITPEPPEWEDFDEDEDVVDLRANHVLGGVFHFNLMSLPPQPKTVNNWTITRVVDPPVIDYVDYVADNMNPALNKEGQSPTQDKDKQAETKRDEKPQIGVTMKLPEDCLFTEEPQIARWDEAKKHWRQDGFTDFSFNEETRVFSFKTSYFGTMALLQDAHINMPFQSWEIRPHRKNAAVFTIIAAIIEIEIEIQDAMCCLSKPDDKPELEHLKKKWMTPKDLIKSLRAVGINVFPADDSAKYVSIQNKDEIVGSRPLDKHPVLEEWCYEQMALVASGVAFSWSKWNSDTPDKEKILFQGSEALQDEPLLEEDWSLFLMTKRRSMKLKMTEFDDGYDEELAEGTEFRSNLYHLLLENVSAEAKERIKDSDYQFVDCVQQLLSATKILTYA